MRNLKLHIYWRRWTKVIISVSAVTLLGTCTPLPGLIDQIKTLGELRVVTARVARAVPRQGEEPPQDESSCPSLAISPVIRQAGLFVPESGALEVGTVLRCFGRGRALVDPGRECRCAERVGFARRR